MFDARVKADVARLDELLTDFNESLDGETDPLALRDAAESMLVRAHIRIQSLQAFIAEQDMRASEAYQTQLALIATDFEMMR